MMQGKAQHARHRGTSWLLPLAGMSLVAAALAGCGEDSDGGKVCDTSAKAAVNARVIGGAAVGQCNVEVTVTATDFEEKLQCRAEGTTCECFGVWERPGTYEVTVTRAGTVIGSGSATATPGECHVNAISVEVDATESDGGGGDAG